VWCFRLASRTSCRSGSNSLYCNCSEGMPAIALSQSSLLYPFTGCRGAHWRGSQKGYPVTSGADIPLWQYVLSTVTSLRQDAPLCTCPTPASAKVVGVFITRDWILPSHRRVVLPPTKPTPQVSEHSSLCSIVSI
jgi:hypothetical protein